MLVKPTRSHAVGTSIQRTTLPHPARSLKPSVNARHPLRRTESVLDAVDDLRDVLRKCLANDGGVDE